MSIVSYHFLQASETHSTFYPQKWPFLHTFLSLKMSFSPISSPWHVQFWCFRAQRCPFLHLLSLNNAVLLVLDRSRNFSLRFPDHRSLFYIGLIRGRGANPFPGVVCTTCPNHLILSFPQPKTSPPLITLTLITPCPCPPIVCPTAVNNKDSDRGWRLSTHNGSCLLVFLPADQITSAARSPTVHTRHPRESGKGGGGKSDLGVLWWWSILPHLHPSDHFHPITFSSSGRDLDQSDQSISGSMAMMMVPILPSDHFSSSWSPVFRILLHPEERMMINQFNMPDQWNLRSLPHPLPSPIIFHQQEEVMLIKLINR